MQEHLSALMASMWADPDVAKSFRAYAQEHAPPGFEAGPESVVAYIRAEQELSRIRADVDAMEAAAVVISVPFARSMEHALNALFLAPVHFPEREAENLPPAVGFPIPVREDGTISLPLIPPEPASSASLIPSCRSGWGRVPGCPGGARQPDAGRRPMRAPAARAREPASMVRGEQRSL
jgi:hypothetical protein